MKKPSEPKPQPSTTHEVKDKRSKSLRNSADTEAKVKSRSKTKTVETPASNNKLYSGKAVWGPGGYARDRERSGSLESDSTSDSSSRSTGSEHAVVKTNAEVGSR